MNLKEKYRHCQLCGNPQDLHAHHIVFRSQGGGDGEDNLIVLCARCHQLVHDERIRVSRNGDEVTFIEVETGEIVKSMTLLPYDATEDSPLAAEATAVEAWSDPANMSERLKERPTEELVYLYSSLVNIRKNAWVAQSLIIAEVKRRSTYGNNDVRNAAAILGISVSTAYNRALQAELVKDPDLESLTTVLPEESWWTVAAHTDEPKRWIQHAAERRADDQGYSIRRFKAEIAMDAKGPEQVTTMQAIVVVYNGQALTPADERLARQIDREYGVPVYALNSLPPEATRLSAGRLIKA